MADRYSYMVVTTDFDLEPLLDQYLATYPEGQFQSYNVVFKTSSEDAQSYIVVFTLFPPKGRVIRFSEFLDAYCKLNNKVAAASQVSSGFPDFKRTSARGYHVFGNPKPVKGTTES